MRCRISAGGYPGGMADDTHHDDAPVELLAPPPGAQMLTTLGMAKKTPGWCACGEHPEDAHDDDGGET